ncbi:PIR protein [Plasmodium vivax]|uniref:VIR protein n=1 Tax=Plasmodium vivax TaxID=5855 RepID=A0A565A5V2_PLAVI|nr:PIR protein [Plasmodium vivax]
MDDAGKDYNHKYLSVIIFLFTFSVNMSIYFLSIKKISKGSNLLINKKAFLIVVMKKNFFYINNFQNFRVPCKKIGEYFSELHDDVFNKDKVMRCKFMNYLINSDETYNKINGIDISDLMEAYEKLSIYRNMCYTDINLIKQEILEDLKELYNLYENYNNIKIVSDDRSQEGNCEKASKCVQYYNKYINNCRITRSREFCNELANFQGKYNHLMQSVNNCGDTKKYLEPIETNYISPIITTTVITLIFTPLGSCIRNRGIKTQKTKDKIYRDTVELSYNYDNEEIDSSKDKYNVQYNSV